VDGKVNNTSNLEEFVEQSGKFQRGYSKRHWSSLTVRCMKRIVLRWRLGINRCFLFESY
jgi:hypothetical protein